MFFYSYTLLGLDRVTSSKGTFHPSFGPVVIKIPFLSFTDLGGGVFVEYLDYAEIKRYAYIS